MSSLVNDGTILGLLIGSYYTGKIVTLSFGRIGTAKLANIVVILGCLPQMALNIWFQIIGKFIVGLGTGVLLVTTTIYVAETLPGSSIGKCLTSINIGISTGYVISSLI